MNFFFLPPFLPISLIEIIFFPLANSNHVSLFSSSLDNRGRMKASHPIPEILWYIEDSPNAKAMNNKYSPRLRFLELMESVSILYDVVLVSK